jgi:hypothetical protein
VVLLLESSDIFVKGVEDWSDTFEIMLLKGLELLDGSEQFNEL